MMPLRRRVFVLMLAVLSLAAPAVSLAAAPAVARVAAPVTLALPDTGLFAPVAAQWRGRLERLAGAPAGVNAERIQLLLDTGDPAAAAALAAGPVSADDAVAVAQGRAALAVQDFARVDALRPRLSAIASADARAVLLRDAYLRDDAAGIDSRARGSLASGDAGHVPELLVLARIAYDMLEFARADSLYARALAATPASESVPARRARANAHMGHALVMQKRREWDASLAELQQSIQLYVTPEALETLAQTLIRLGRTDEAISAAQWGVRLDPYHDPSHYLLGNGYARKNYTQLLAAYPRAFADAAGQAALRAADAKLAAGQRADAHAAYAAVVAAHPGWVDARIRLASLDFEDGRFDAARDGCFAALAVCPEYGRAHAILAKALESQRYVVDVHRAAYEQRFNEAEMPQVPQIERFVLNWKSLSPRHQKRVALSMAPWKAFVPLLVEGGATFYIKPMFERLSDQPLQRALRDQRIDYDSRLWDDVRGCGGYHTVTGIEDVERTIFDKYNTVTHEFSHQVHAVLPPADQRVIQDLYRAAKERDDKTKNGFLSRYAGGSVFEYFAEGVNAIVSPKRDTYDPREIVAERLTAIDSDLENEVVALLGRTDVSASYPIAFAAGGDDRIERGKVGEALPLYRRALGHDSTNESVLVSYSNALLLGGRAAAAESVAAVAARLHPESGAVQVARANAAHCARGLMIARAQLMAARAAVRREDLYRVDLALADFAYAAGDSAAALAAYDSVLAYQSDQPEGMRGRAAALALAGRFDAAFELYDAAVRARTGVASLRADFARDLLAAGRTADAKRQLDAAALLDERDPQAEALRAQLALATGDAAAASLHAKQALAWGPWCDRAAFVAGLVRARSGDAKGAAAVWAPLRARLAAPSKPQYVYRSDLATWVQTHALPQVERREYTAALKP